MSVPNQITLGHPEAHEKLTARLFWKRKGESGYNDAGNVKDYVDATTRSLVTRARAENGFRNINDEQADVNHEAWTFLLDEHVPEQEKLLRLAKQLTDEQQASAEGATASLTGVKGGRWFSLGNYNIANVTVTGSVAGFCDEGTDYEIDKENGRLRVIPGGTIADGETLTCTFDEPQINFEKYSSQDNPLFYCDVILEEHNQFHKMWLRKLTMSAYLNVTEWPSQTGEFGQYRVKVTPSAPVSILKRGEGQTLPSHVEGGAPANSSSSSSNSSTSSGDSSSSSSS
jgi:hypothetical protein